MKKTNYSSYKTGLLAELWAKVFLYIHCYTIIASRFIVGSGKGSKAGEIDIIAKKIFSKTICFIEVKKRKTIELASYSIKKEQMRRIYHSAEVFIKQNPKYKDYDFRFDAILINSNFKIKHIKNAWYM